MMKTKATKADETPLEEERRETISQLNESPDDTTGQPLLLTVFRTYTSEGARLAHEEVSKTLQVQEFISAPARVGVDLSQTVNLGNYESIRVGVNLQIPCYAEEAENAYEYASRFCKQRLVAERDAAKEWAKRQKAAGNVF